MRLTVSHRTHYTFAEPIRGVVQSHRLFPADCENQRVLNWAVTVEDAETGAGFRDGAGDWIQTVTLRRAVAGVTILVEGLVETQDLNGVLTGHAEKVHPSVYLRDTRATMPSKAIRRMAEGVAEAEKSPLDLAHGLSREVSKMIEYRPGETDASTSATEALELGYGVCQDYAHVLIAAAISVGIPARYVAGYLYSEAGDEMAEASHAWAELYLKGLGWVGFDAANECCPDARYIRLGSGFDALDAAPIRGVAHGETTEHLDVEVSVGQVQQ